MKVIKYENNKEYDAIQYTGNYGEIISFVGANNINFIDEQFYIKIRSNTSEFIDFEIANYNDFIIKDENNNCHVCKVESMFNLYRKA
jgi:hypothetical protein